MKSYYIYTYGCQMNTADSERLSHQLESVGYIPTENVENCRFNSAKYLCSA